MNARPPKPSGPPDISVDVRICCVGDSFTQGVGDREGGWVGRLATQATDRGYRVTAYNLGVRRETSADIAGRWYAEAARRLNGGDARGVVFAFGVNDVTRENGRLRVARDEGVRHLGAVLDTARQAGWPVLVAGIPPVTDEVAAHADLAGLEDAFRQTCEARGVPFIPVNAALRGNPVWWHSVDAHGDGAHCDPRGHELLTDLIGAGGWWPWLDALAASGGNSH
ncbi:MAG: G-D-S-L family lipolytic protein [Streptomycetaceae bacterium]|nr:G-D-S-L family lipolytic protein [Streptomycetaceae bacterium]